MLTRVKNFLKSEEGVGVVEMILILIVLVSLVVLFRENLNDIAETIWEKINAKTGTFQ